MTEEAWRAVSGLEGLYEVSSEGRVRSLDRVIVQPCSKKPEKLVRRRFKGRILPIKRFNERYPYVIMGRRRRERLHVLVAEAFIGPRPAGMWVLHNDDDPLNNRADNLRYGAPQENHDDRRRNGHSFRGSANGAAVVEEATVSILMTARRFVLDSVLGRLAGTAPANVGLMGRRTWLHVKPATVEAARQWLRDRGVEMPPTRPYPLRRQQTQGSPNAG